MTKTDAQRFAMKAGGKGRWMLPLQGVRYLLFGLCLLLGGLAQATPSRPAEVQQAPLPPLPQGHWEGSYTRSERTPRICLDLLPKERILLTFHDLQYRNPVVVVGSYVLSPSEHGLELLVTVERIVTKEIGPCRRFWVRMNLPQYKVFGMKIAPQRKLLVRVKLSCEAGTSKVQLCLHDPQQGADPSKDHCQQLSAPSGSKCQPGSARSLDDILPPSPPSSSPRNEREFL